LYANGITISDDNRLLFVAHNNGITRIELSSSALLELKPPPKQTLADADGIYFYNNSIIAVQTDQHRVNRYRMNKELNQVIRTDIMEAWNPAFDQPTTGVLAGDTFYYIANSQYDSFENGEIFPIDKLKDVIILKTKLR
jgi:sugar lactone lactonase YvrE